MPDRTRGRRARSCPSSLPATAWSRCAHRSSTPDPAPRPGPAGATRDPRRPIRVQLAARSAGGRRPRRSSPTCGSWPSAAITKPATVSYGPSGSSTPGLVLEVVEVEQAVDLDVAADGGRVVGVVVVVLVADVADELLDEVLEGDDAGGAAVLVDDDREVVPRRGASRTAPASTRLVPGSISTSRASVADPDARGRPSPGRAGRARGRSRRRRRRSRGSPGSASAAGQRHRRAALYDRHRRVEEVDLGARHHHLAQLPVAGLEDVLDRSAAPRRRASRAR